MNALQKFGLSLFLIALLAFTASLFLGTYQLSQDSLQAAIPDYKKEQRAAIIEVAMQEKALGQSHSSNISFVQELTGVLKKAQQLQDDRAGIDPANNIWSAQNLPEGVSEWNFRMSDGDIDQYLLSVTKASTQGIAKNNSGLLLFLSFFLGVAGSLIYLLPKLQKSAGIKNDNIYWSPNTRGIPLMVRSLFLLTAIAFGIVIGFSKSVIMAVLTIVAGLLIIGLTYLFNRKRNIPAQPNFHRSASPENSGLGYIGLAAGIYLIGFYILLYFFPYYITPWILMVDPVSQIISGNPASQWFLYGFLYTLVIIVMGIRMLIKYRHNQYQLIRTGSVMFFQTAFAFLIPEILVRLNQPYMDLKNAWPLDYDLFYDYQINSFLGGGSTFSLGGLESNVGTLMLIWGIALSFVVVPLMTYFYGKRWYCSWVCGCGGLAETLGDPYRQLSDKSLRAWKYERYIIHGVLVFAVVMTALVLYTYYSGNSQVIGLDSYRVRSYYGFFIGSMFSGVVGTGFYPIMGNRVWCRFGCPLAAGMGLVQRLKSRFRITTNGGQCISCGNCSTYCEMGIDVRWYAQRGQDIVRASCVGCGICSAVCPRGVLRLENGSLDMSQRATATRSIHIQDGKLSIPMDV